MLILRLFTPFNQDGSDIIYTMYRHTCTNRVWPQLCAPKSMIHSSIQILFARRGGIILSGWCCDVMGGTWSRNNVSVTQCCLLPYSIPISMKYLLLFFYFYYFFGGGVKKHCFVPKYSPKPKATFHHSGDEHLRFSHLV